MDGRALVEQQEQWTANRRFIFLFPSSRASRSCRAPREISRLPRLAHKAPVMQASCSVDVDHFIRLQVWTENFCFVFIVRVLFSNLSGIVWTGPKISRRRRPRKRRFKSDFAIYKTST